MSRTSMHNQSRYIQTNGTHHYVRFTNRDIRDEPKPQFSKRAELAGKKCCLSSLANFFLRHDSGSFPPLLLFPVYVRSCVTRLMLSQSSLSLTFSPALLLLVLPRFQLQNIVSKQSKTNRESNFISSSCPLLIFQMEIFECESHFANRYNQ